MGSDRKWKKVEEGKERWSRKKKRHSTSDSEDYRKSKKKHRIHDCGDESRSKKSHREDKRKDTKSHDRSKHKEKKTDEKHKSKRHKRDQLKLNIKELSADDYFSKHNEFAMWLKEEKNIYFNELSSDSTHLLFGDFAKAWNDHKLDLQYYEGIQTAPRTGHSWNIKK